MGKVLREDFGVEVFTIEAQSRTTYENAVKTSVLLKELGIERVAIVTHAWHMQRSMRAFHSRGVDAIAAPTAFVGHVRPKASALLFPHGSALHNSATVLYEYIGQLWYWVRY